MWPEATSCHEGKFIKHKKRERSEMRDVKVQAPKGTITYNELCESDVWQFHRQGELPDFLPVMWAKTNLANPLLAKSTESYYQAIFGGLIGGISNLGLLVINAQVPEIMRIISCYLGVALIVVMFCLVFGRKYGTARGCTGTYAQDVCNLFNRLSHSFAEAGKVMVSIKNLNAQTAKGLIEDWLIRLLVEAHQCQEVTTTNTKGLSFEESFALMVRVASIHNECQLIANAGCRFGLVERDLAKYHQAADVLIKAKKDAAEAEAKAEAEAAAAKARLPGLAEELIGKPLASKA